MSSCQTEPYEKMVLKLDKAKDGKTPRKIQGEALYIKSISSGATLTVKINKESADELDLNESGGLRYIRIPFEKLYFKHDAQTGKEVEFWILRKGTALLKGGDFLVTNIETIEEIIKIIIVETIKEILSVNLIKNIEIIGNMPDLTLYGSSGVAFKQTDAGAGAWQNPNGHSDPDGGWLYEQWAYDDNLELCAYRPAWTYPEWTSFLHLTTASISSNKLRFYAKTTDGKGETDHKIDIDVLRNGVWIHVYEGHFKEEVWVEKSYPQGTITEARIRFYDALGKTMELCEFDFWQVPAIGGVMIIEEQGLLESPPEGKTITAKGYTYDGEEMATRTFYEGEELLFTITMTYVDGKLSSQVRT